MFKNYINIAIRNLFKHKLYSTINISGLAIGLTAVMLITLYSWDEMTFNGMYPNIDNTYKLELAMSRGGRPPQAMSNTAGAIAPGLLSEMSDIVDQSARIRNRDKVVTVNGHSQSIRVGTADAAIFEIFKVPFVSGNSENPLVDPSSVVLNESMAIRLFGDEPALDKVIDLDDGKSYRVTGVIKDQPRNTHLDLSIVFAKQPEQEDSLDSQMGWYSISMESYIRLKEGVTIDALKAKIPAFIEKYVEAGDPEKKSSDEYGVTFIPMKDVHFETAAPTKGEKTILMGFIAIAAIILAIASFNFMNMSLSRTITRAREVAVRKTLGATKTNIIHQFVAEALLTTILAFVIAMALTEISLPYFNAFVTKFLLSGTLVTPIFLGGTVLLIALVGLISGYYPATIMARFNPAEILRGGRASSKNSSLFRTILVTVQFSVAIGLTIAASVVFNQIKYLSSMDPGFTKENILVVHDLDHPDVSANALTLQNLMSNNSDIVSVALSDSIPGGTYGWITGLESINGEPVTDMSLRGQIVDANFFPTMKMSMLAGRNFNADLDSDYNRRIGGDYKDSNIIINETAVRTLGFSNSEDALGKTINDGSVKTITGVVKDFMIGSAKRPIPAMHYIMDEQSPRLLTLRYKTNDLPNLIAFVDKTWKSLLPNRPIRKNFLDEDLAKMYGVEEHQGDIFALFASLAVLVSCIGLYGLASLTIDQRTKEIGLRKVMGASVLDITKQILWDFSKAVLLANLIAWPLAFYFMSDWLEKFVYRIDLSPTTFILAGILAMLVAWATVASHVIRVARSNPIKALRYE